jgi:hypothetical protein
MSYSAAEGTMTPDRFATPKNTFKIEHAILVGLLLCWLASPAFPATMPPVRMKVVDEQDGSPLAGAFVLFQASAHEGTFTGHGGKTAVLFAAEAVTDDAGELQIPKQEFSAQPFFLNTNYHNPQMVFFKPGYAAVTLINYRMIIAELRDVTTWMYDRQTIKMQRATTDKETASALGSAASLAQQSVDVKSCSWKKIPRFLSAVHRSAADWERKRPSLTDQALRFNVVRSPLGGILMNDADFAQHGCGSPRAFFEVYLR